MVLIIQRRTCAFQKKWQQTNKSWWERDGEGKGRKTRAYVTLLMEGVYLQFHVCNAVKSRVVFSDGRYRHSVGCLWPSVLGVWRLSESLEGGSETDLGWVWAGGGRGPRRLCVRRGGPPRPGGQCEGSVGVRWSWAVRPSLWAPAVTWASVADCHPGDSPNCCLWMRGYLEFENGHDLALSPAKLFSVSSL